VTEDETRVEPSEAPVARFWIDIGAIEKSGRSFDVMVEQRLCAAARRRLGEGIEERQPRLDAAAGAVTFAAQHSALSPLDLIQRYCADDLDYLHPDLTLLEAVFRLFLLNGNTPMTLSQLREELDHWPSFADRLRPLPDEQVVAMLVRDRYYGIRQVVE
jgi:hypothetical protein